MVNLTQVNKLLNHSSNWPSLLVKLSVAGMLVETNNGVGLLLQASGKYKR